MRAAELREHIAKREYDNHQTQLAQARDVEDFLTNEKRKTTSENFYLWMKREAQSLYAQCFQFAYDIAKKAERAFQHELGDPNSQFIKTGYMGGREGLFTGEKLFLDLKRMDMAYAELNAREFEITKHISLRDWFPIQLLELRADGRCEIRVPEALFDLDCPGHFFRRIKSVAVSIPCVTGPYASVNCGLRLLGSHVRTKATPLGGEWYPADPENPDTERFTVYPVAKDSIVTSSAQSDTGMFEPSLRDERYLPFEGAGVISKWAIELLGMPRQFDYDTISDVVLTVRYTARAGAPQATVSPAVATWLKANSTRLFSVRHEFPTEWAKFKSVKINGATKIAELTLNLRQEHYPFWSQGRLDAVKRVDLFARTAKSGVEVTYKADNQENKVTLDASLGNLRTAPLKDTPLPVPIGKFSLYVTDNSMEDLWLALAWGKGD